MIIEARINVSDEELAALKCDQMDFEVALEIVSRVQRAVQTNSFNVVEYVRDHVANAEGELVDAGEVKVILDSPTTAAGPRQMYMIVGVDRGEGYYRIDSAGLQVWLDPEVAREEMRRWMFNAGHAVVTVEVCAEPRSLGTAEQQKAWKERKK